MLPVPLEVISGQREAELIYMAVAHHLGEPAGGRLTIDVGGGSTELAWSNGGGAPQLPAHKVSIDIGCVAFKDLYFSTASDRAEAYAAAREAARQLLVLEFGDQQSPPAPAEVLGTSGTIESILMVLKANGWSHGIITPEALQQLEQGIAMDGWVVDAGLPGLAPDRVDIFPAGVAILSACFEVLGLSEVRYADVTLLQGIICDNLARTGDFRIVVNNLAEDSLEQLAKQFSVDRAQAARVARCAQRLFDDAGVQLAGSRGCRHAAPCRSGARGGRAHQCAALPSPRRLYHQAQRVARIFRRTAQHAGIAGSGTSP